MPGEEFCADGQLVRGEPERFARDRFRHAVELEQNISRPHRRDPIFRLPFAFAHSRFRRARGDGLVRENTDPQFAFALHASRQRDARRFDLRVRDPGTLERLQAELAEINSQIARSRPLAAAPLGLPVLHAFRHQWHNSLLKISKRRLARAVAEEPRQAPRRPAPLSYKASISRRSFRKLCSLPRSRNRSACARYATALCPRDTIPNAKFPRHSTGPSCATEFLVRRNPSPPAPPFSSRADKQCGAR